MDLSEVTQFEAKTDTRTISQLIRDGAKLRPQCFLAYSTIIVDPEKGMLLDANGHALMGSCALGAAYEAKFGRLPTNEGSFEGLCRQLGISRTKGERIMILNDEQRMPRECIASLLEKK